MPLTKEFLLKHGLIRIDESMITKDFTTVPSGKFNLDQFRKNRSEFWEILTESGEHIEKRSVIVCDWLYQYGAKQPDYSYMLDLLKQHVPLYFWTGELTKITNQEDLFKYIGQIQPANAADITQAAESKDIEYNKIKILNYFSNQNLLQDTINSEQCLNLNDILSIKQPKILEKILNDLKKEKSITLRLTDLDYENCDQSLLKLMLETLPIDKIDFQNLYDKLSLAKLSELNLSRIKSFKANKYVGDLADINQALINMPQLESLEVNGLLNINEVPAIHKHEHLKELILLNEINKHEPDPSEVEKFSTFLQQFDNLERIHLSKTPNITDSLADLITKGFPKLSALTLNSMNLAPQLMVQLLANHPNLEKFILRDTAKTINKSKYFDQLMLQSTNQIGIQAKEKQILDLTTFPKSTKLKTLEFTNTDIETNHISSILENFPELENLTLDSSWRPYEVTQFKKLLLPKLKWFKMNGSLDDADYANFLQNCSLLESYDIRTSTKLNQAMKVSLPHLQSLEVSIESAALELETLLNFFGLQPVLKQLTTKLDYTSNNNSIEFPPIKNLESCTIRTSCDSKALERLIQKCPNLKNISFEKELSGWEVSSPVTPQNLTHVKISDVDIEKSPVARELLHNPKITDLEIKNNVNAEMLNQIRVDMPNLTHLLLKYSGSRPIFFPHSFSFLKGCPALKTLTIDWDHYSKAFIADAEKKEQEKIDDFKKIFGDDVFPNVENLSFLLQIPNQEKNTFKLTDLLTHFPNIRCLKLGAAMLAQLKYIDTTLYPQLKTIVVNSDAVDPDYLDKLQAENPQLSFVVIPNKTFMGNLLAGYGLDTNKSQSSSAADANGIYSLNDYKVDTDTELHKDKRLDANEYFLRKQNGLPSLNHYRLQVYHKSTAKFSATDCIITHKIGDLRNSYEEIKSDPYLFYGGINIKPGEFTPLPSLTALDNLVQIESPVKLKVQKSDLGIYYVCPILAKDSKNLSSPIKINFIVYAKLTNPKLNFITPELTANLEALFKSLRFADGQLSKESMIALEPILQLPLPERIALLANFCRSFKPGTTPKGKNEDEDLNNIIQSGHGACRHRTKVFVSLAESLAISAYSIVNDVHALVEVETDQGITMIDLGGYPANIVVHKIADDTKLVAPNPLIEILNQREVPYKEKKNIRSVFNMWEKTKKIAATDYQDFCDKLMKDALQLPQGKRNVLITFNTAEEMQAFNAALTRYQTEKNSNNIYIDKFQEINDTDLVINEAGVGKEIKSRIVTDVERSVKGDTLAFNLAQYNTNAVSYCNALTDNPRKLLKTKVPEGATVIGMRLHDTYIGPDVYSRFGASYQCPSGLEKNLYNHKVVDATTVSTDIGHYDSINCYDGSNWREELCGKYHINGDNFQFDKGLLIRITAAEQQANNSNTNLKTAMKGAIEAKDIKAIKNLLFGTMNQNQSSSTNIVIYNPPNLDPEFQLFLLELANKNSFRENGVDYQLPDNLKIILANKIYDLTQTKYQYSVEQSESIATPWHYPLNLETFSLFFSTYTTKDGQMFEMPGWLANHINQEITLLVSDKFEPSLWAKLLDAASHVNCKLHLIFPKHIPIPLAMQVRNQKKHTSENNKPLAELIISNDLDLTAEKYKGPNVTIVSVNQKQTYADLIEFIDVKKEKTNIFSYEARAILKSLQAGETVVLKGKLSKSLSQALQTLWADPPYLFVNGKKEMVDSIKGRLIIVTDEKHHFDVKPNENHQLNLLKRLAHLENKHDTDDTVKAFSVLCFDIIKKLEKEESFHLSFTYAAIHAMFKHWKAEPESDFISPFVLMHPQYKQMEQIIRNNFAKKPEQIFKSGDDVIEQRLQEIDRVFVYSPYVFLVGPSGSGKSTILLEEYKKRPNTEVFTGFENLEACLKSKTDHQKILFIDEANLEKQGALDLFEGLFDDPPGIIANGQFYPADNLRVVFAGNYADYAKRQKQGILRHGAVIEFGPLPDIFLIEKVMSPLFTKFEIDLNKIVIDSIMQQFLEFYHEAMKLKVPLTPRNLINMVQRFYLLFSKSQEENKNQEGLFKQYIWSAVYNEIENIKNDKIKNSLQSFIQERSEIVSFQEKLNSAITVKSDVFILTESRKIPLRNLDQQLQLRQLNIDHPELKLKGGAAGMLFEGPAGIGKTKMVTEFLTTSGYQNPEDPFYRADQSNHVFYHIIPSMDPEKVQSLLVKAFHSGAIVVIDEFSSFNLEKILNRLMSGVDMEGNAAEKQGFFVVATQNPITYKGRQALSPAMENRFVKISLPEYTTDELMQIAAKKGLSVYLATQLVEDYLVSHKIAIEESKDQIPTFRDFERTLDIIKANLQIPRYQRFVEDVMTMNFNPMLEEHDASFSALKRDIFEAICDDNKINFDKNMDTLQRKYADFKVRELNLKKGYGLYQASDQFKPASATTQTKIQKYH